MANKKINVTRKEFQQSYWNHYKLYQNSNDSPKTRRLILFYSVECGLKSLIMKETGNNTYNELENYCQCNGGKRLAGHDIKAMIKEVNPRNEYILKNIRLKNSGGSVPPSRYNELWRYGAEVEDLDQEETTEKTLIRIAEWIKTRI
ncbi:hypothetical protein H6B11_10205 [Mediterraneibacter glycyrrhizinilyticus]|nr:hypothetical protein [Mediterraneibacter glycyrrhizinilyticus]MBM6854525.1 hypothetical protein [Mediterraneibacter glycyrrhizinilyticus]